MLIRSGPDLPAAGERAELILRGPGATSICLVELDGSVVLTVRLRVAGAERVLVRTHLPLRLDRKDGVIELIPVLAYQSNSEQIAQIMGEDHAAATVSRLRLLDVTDEIFERRRVEWHARERAYWHRELPAELTG